MAGIKIVDLPDLGRPFNATDIIEVSDDGNGSYKANIGNFTLSVGGAHVLLKPMSGRAYGLSINGGVASATISTGSTQLIAYPFYPANNLTISKIIFEVSTVSAAGGICTVCIYDSLNGYPNSRVFQSSNIATDTSGYKTITCNYSFIAGNVYWITMTQSLSATFRAMPIFSCMPISLGAATGTTFNSTQLVSSFTTNPGSEPATFPAGALLSQNNQPNFNLVV